MELEVLDPDFNPVPRVHQADPTSEVPPIQEDSRKRPAEDPSEDDSREHKALQLARRFPVNLKNGDELQDGQRGA